MRIRYDPEVDALAIHFRETSVTTRKLADVIVAEYDAADRLAGLEILDAARVLADPAVFREITVEVIGQREAPK